MAGIPSAADAQEGRHVALARVAQRLTVIAGLVVGGWLLASGTGWADEHWAQPDEGRQGGAVVNLVAPVSSIPAAATPLIETGAEVLPAVQVPPPVLDTVTELVGEPAAQPDPEPALAPALQPDTAPRAPSGATVPDRLEPSAPAEAIGPTEALSPAAPAPPTGPAGATEPAIRVTGPATTGGSQQIAGHEIPSCPAGLAGVNGNSYSGAHAITLTIGSPRADHAGGRPRLSSRAAGLPVAPDQQPSTSPD